jgi:multidrug resistance protein, MATE family
MMEVPIDILFNYLLVWGPESIRLGFIGSPIAMAIAVTLTSTLYIVYGLFFVPKTAWHPFSMYMFKNLGFLARLGFAGFGEWFRY